MDKKVFIGENFEGQKYEANLKKVVVSLDTETFEIIAESYRVDSEGGKRVVKEDLIPMLKTLKAANDSEFMRDAQTGAFVQKDENGNWPAGAVTEWQYFYSMFESFIDNLLVPIVQQSGDRLVARKM